MYYVLSHSTHAHTPLTTPVPQSGSESLNSLELSPRKSTSRLKQILATKDPPKRRRVTVPKKVVDQIETILRAFPTGIWLSRFPNEFKVVNINHKSSAMPHSRSKSQGWREFTLLLSRKDVCMRLDVFFNDCGILLLEILR